MKNDQAESASNQTDIDRAAVVSESIIGFLAAYAFSHGISVLMFAVLLYFETGQINPWIIGVGYIFSFFKLLLPAFVLYVISFLFLYKLKLSKLWQHVILVPFISISFALYFFHGSAVAVIGSFAALLIPSFTAVCIFWYFVGHKI